MKRTVFRGLIRIIGAVLSILLVLPLVPFANAQNDWNMSAFLKAYSDPHFNLTSRLLHKRTDLYVDFPTI